eukprot:CAMPEP_0176447042 /NCGR_PEP_ID=MMETSP0127-20121128/24751_1 /TAXON_ID=938130 /ORGANISM="Platyophrya macrostoma, Strain WH" /LENGTH=224 /DNA_ID=CAMNT_0017833323 /DNA_START=29 /DNA_END=706 /DNA_ORIENTATION=-
MNPGNFGGRSGMLMTKGVMKMKTDPPSFVCSMRVFRHPSSGKTVTLNPIPNIAAPSFFRDVLETNHLKSDVDVILCEDGRVPYVEGSFEAKKLKILKTLIPVFGYRPVVDASCQKYEGLAQRDPVESRMAYTSVTQALEPPVDARARRAVERIETYPPNTHVVLPWNVYHIVYFSHVLPQLGYELVKEEERVVIDMKQILLLMVVLGLISCWTVMTTLRLLFGF